ncbi:hypothetical protein DFH06DRAFT_610582 [Mycena polygramma]|nr:hypothetical protein DFH06DRAFT_610582 [Mycena polygramma]
MIASSSLTVLLSAAAVLASTHTPRTHKGVARSFDAEKRSFLFTNQELTWYPTDTGPDACTGKTHTDSDYYVAMRYDLFGDGSACCGKQVSITANGKTATATCVDECMTCADKGSLDLTKGLFEYFSGGDLGVGVLSGSWSYVDGSGSGGSDTTTTKKTTTAAPTTTKKTTTSTTQAKPTTTPTSTTEKKTTATPTTTEAKPTTEAKTTAKPTTSTTQEKPTTSSTPAVKAVKPTTSTAAAAKATTSSSDDDEE